MSDIEIYDDHSNMEEENCSLLDDDNNTNTFESHCQNNEYLELLIAEVFQREALWNSLLPYKFRGPSETKTLWTEIDIYLGTPVGTSQTKWKNLRDRFVKEHTLQSTYIPSGSAAIKKRSSWPLYESLLFLVPTIAYRKTKSNIENVNPQTNMLHFQENKEYCSSIATKKREGNERQDISRQSMPKQKILKSQLQPMQTSLLKSRQTSCGGSNSSNSSICSKEVPIYGNAISTPDTSDAENLHVSALTKRKRKTKLENTDNRVEEAIIQELERTRPTYELPHTKPDKIESFVKYVEACLRGMLPDTSKRIIQRFSQILMEEDL